MISHSGTGILLDIEGTTSSVSFVYDEMFPFVRRELRGFLAKQWDEESVQAACGQIAEDRGTTAAEWFADLTTEQQREAVAAQVDELMDADVKATGLKQLQGLIWKSGFASQELQAHIYEDTLPALQRWQAAQRDIRIYSSGSVQAQKLFFGHTIKGDLLSYFRGHYDTKVGSKRESNSYRLITKEFGLPGGEILFLSDVVAELDAAREAGLQTCLCVRPGNAEVAAGHGHDVVESFDDVVVPTD